MAKRCRDCHWFSVYPKKSVKNALQALNSCNNVSFDKTAFLENLPGTHQSGINQGVKLKTTPEEAPPSGN